MKRKQAERTSPATLFRMAAWARNYQRLRESTEAKKPVPPSEKDRITTWICSRLGWDPMPKERALIQACDPKRASFADAPSRVSLLHRESRCPISHAAKITVADKILKMNKVDPPGALTPEAMEQHTKVQLLELAQHRGNAEYQCAAAQIVKSSMTLSSFSAGLQQRAQNAKGQKYSYPLMTIVAIDVRHGQLIYQLEPPAGSCILSLCEGFGLLDKVMGSSKSKSTLWLDRVELQLLIEEWSFECLGHMPQNAQKITDSALRSWVTAFMKLQKVGARERLAALHERFKLRFDDAGQECARMAVQIPTFDCMQCPSNIITKGIATFVEELGLGEHGEKDGGQWLHVGNTSLTPRLRLLRQPA